MQIQLFGGVLIGLGLLIACSGEPGGTLIDETLTDEAHPQRSEDGPQTEPVSEGIAHDTSPSPDRPRLLGQPIMTDHGPEYPDKYVDSSLARRADGADVLTMGFQNLSDGVLDLETRFIVHAGDGTKTVEEQPPVSVPPAGRIEREASLDKYRAQSREFPSHAIAFTKVKWRGEVIAVTYSPSVYFQQRASTLAVGLRDEFGGNRIVRKGRAVSVTPGLPPHEEAFDSRFSVEMEGGQ